MDFVELSYNFKLYSPTRSYKEWIILSHQIKMSNMTDDLGDETRNVLKWFLIANK